MLKHAVTSSWIIPVGMGICAFLFLVGPAVLHPGNTDWIPAGDPAQAYLGWLFFRQAPWTLPPGSSPAYGMELATSIVFTDSNPLAALFFKLFSPLLPATFQYLGFWLLCCLVLQALFAWKLLTRLCGEDWIRIPATLLFLLAPPMLLRMTVHFCLAGHFLILAALYLYLTPQRPYRHTAWRLLLAAGTLIHAYLLAMTAAIRLADILRQDRHRPLRALCCGAVDLLVILSCAWFAGYFLVASGEDYGYGIFNLDMLALFNAQGWSSFLPKLPSSADYVESFVFPGSGALFLLVCAAVVLLVRRNAPQEEPWWRQHWPLLFVLCCMTLFALSNELRCGPWHVSFPLPAFMERIASIFRASGRMFWPVGYCLLLGGVAVLLHRCQRKTAVLLLVLAAGIQLADIQAGKRQLDASFRAPSLPVWDTRLAAELRTLPDRPALRVFGTTPRTYWLEAGYAAGMTGKSTDAVSLARLDNGQSRDLREKKNAMLRSGSYPADITGLLTPQAALLASATLSKADRLYAFDDKFLLVPGGAGNASARPPVPSDIVPAPPFGVTLKTSEGGAGVPCMASGWASPENWACWMDCREATLVIPLAKTAPSALLLDVFPLPLPERQQEVHVRINDCPAGPEIYRPTERTTLHVPLSAEMRRKAEAQGFLLVDIACPEAIRPHDYGIRDGRGYLSIALHSFTLVP